MEDRTKEQASEMPGLGLIRSPEELCDLSQNSSPLWAPVLRWTRWWTESIEGHFQSGVLVKEEKGDMKKCQRHLSLWPS